MSDFPGKVNITDSDGKAKIMLDGQSGRVGIGPTDPKAQLDVHDAVQVSAPTTQAGAYTEFIACIMPGHLQGFNMNERSNRELRIQTANNEGSYNQFILYNGRIYGDLNNPIFTRGMWAAMSGIEFAADGRIYFLIDPNPADFSDEREITPTTAMQITRDAEVIVGKITLDGTAGDVILQNSDCAEDFDVDETELLEPGTVMVIGNNSKLSQCCTEYDKRVAGVLSGAGDYRPGIVLGRQQSSNRRLPLALTGKVFCRIDASYAPIEVGDLLTTSPTLGHAMKALEPLKAFGAVIGKALQPLREGQGLVPILVALQ